MSNFQKHPVNFKQKKLYYIVLYKVLINSNMLSACKIAENKFYFISGSEKFKP